MACIRNPPPGRVLSKNVKLRSREFSDEAGKLTEMTIIEFFDAPRMIAFFSFLFTQPTVNFQAFLVHNTCKSSLDRLIYKDGVVP